MNFIDVLVLRHIPFRRQVSNPAEIGICCPFCQQQKETADTRYRLSVNVVSGAAYCFNCRWKSRTTTFRKILDELGWPDAEVNDRCDLGEPHPEPRSVVLPDDFTLLSEIDENDPLTQMARRYILHFRRVSEAQILSKSIGVSFDGPYRYRVIIPVVYDRDLKGFVARDITGTQFPKYLNSHGTKSMYNLLHQAQDRKDVLHLSEGVFKALRIEQALGVKSVATLGHSITENQLDQIKRYKYRIATVWSDTDRVGILGAIGIGHRLTSLGCRVKFILPAAPADDLSLDAIRKSAGSAAELDWKLTSNLKASLAFRG